MPSDREQFFTLDSFAVVGATREKPFPKLTYGNLRRAGKRVFPVDLSGAETVEGDPAYGSLGDLPQEVQGVVLEVPRERTLEVVQQAADRGIRDLWIHMGRDTPEALALCQEKGIRVRHGTCAVMYTQQGFSYHSIHKWIMKLGGKY
jgi:predicted CoA-binding protein